MALSAGESFSGGQVRDTQSRSVVISETTDAAVTAGEFYSGGFLCDPDSRTVICQDAAHSALTANEQYTSGEVRDKVGRLVCAAETVNSALSAGSQFSGGWLRDSKGRRIIALDTLGSALSAGEQFTSGQIRDSQGRLVLATETAGSTYNAAVLADSPVSFWPLNETSGTSATDLGSGGNTGTYTGGFTLNQPGPTSDGRGAVLLDGTTGCVLAACPTTTLDNLTLECWVKLSNLTAQRTFFACNGADGSGGWGLHLDGGTRNTSGLVMQASLPAAADVAIGAYTFADTNWHHVAMTRSVTWRGYVDGALIGGVTSTTGAAPATSFEIGRDVFTALFFNGLIARVAVYTTALSGARITAHFAAR